MRIEFTIDELVLIGLEPHDRYAIATDVERALVEQAATGLSSVNRRRVQLRDGSSTKVGSHVARELLAAVNR